MTGATLRRTAPHLLLAFLGMGGWAVLANRSHPLAEALGAGAVQGCLSACLTLAMKRLIEAVVRRLDGWASLVAAPAACGLLSVGVLSLVHTLAGTPEVVATVAVPVAVSTTYAASYAYALLRAGRTVAP